MIKDLRQIDEAFAKKLSGLVVQCADKFTGELNDKEVPVIVMNPEGEFEEESYPGIIIFRSGAYPDNNRWYNDTIKYDWAFFENGNPSSVKEKPNPIPYNVYYSIRLYYQYQEDGVVMNTHLMKVLSRGAYVVIDGDKYDVSLVSYKNPNATYREFGVIKGNKPREFIDQYLYKIEMNLETGIEEIKKFLKPEKQGGGVHINVEIKGERK